MAVQGNFFNKLALVRERKREREKERERERERERKREREREREREILVSCYNRLILHNRLKVSFSINLPWVKVRIRLGFG
jgi:hypothetical protein